MPVRMAARWLSSRGQALNPRIVRGFFYGEVEKREPRGMTHTSMMGVLWGTRVMGARMHADGSDDKIEMARCCREPLCGQVIHI